MSRVTLIISTYNWSSVLPFSVGSALRQNFEDFELLVIGDACTDDSGAVVEKIRRDTGDERVRWINLPFNSGNQFGPNNEGIRQARGEYIAYLGHDDLWLPHHLELLVAALDGGADVAHSTVDWIEPDSTRAPPFPPQHCITPSSVMHRRSLIEKVGPWRDYRDIVVPPDGDLWDRMRDSGARFEWVPRLTVIKFAATSRAGIYREKPCHEQQLWTGRICNEPGLEAQELARLLCLTDGALRDQQARYNRSLSGQCARIRRKLNRRKLNPRSLRQHFKKYGKGDQIREWRHRKGLDP